MQRTGRPVRFRLDRDDDFVLTGKRHDFRIDYAVGFDHAGRVTGVEGTMASRCGYGHDEPGDQRPRHVPRRQCLFLPQP